MSSKWPPDAVLELGLSPIHARGTQQPMPSEGTAAANTASSRETRVGVAAALTAFVLWGFFPIFWRELEWVPALELVMHRAVWGTLFYMLLSFGLGHTRAIGQLLRAPKSLRWLVLSCVLLAINFLTFIYAVEAGRVIEVSLGYFLNPVLSVLLGVVVLREQLTRATWVATALACSGVIVLGSASSGVPWIALILAAAFGIYGLVRKTIQVDVIAGNTIEMGLLCLPALVGLVVLEIRGEGQFLTASFGGQLWLVSTGLVTALPLLAFTAATRRLRLSTIGFMQYLAPSLQLAIAVLLFDEAFTTRHALAFALIWASLGLFAWSRAREVRRAPTPLSARGVVSADPDH